MQDTKEQILELVMEANPSNPIQYVHDIVRDYSRTKLDLCIKSCKDCSICNGPVKTITYGNSNASVLVISDAVNKDSVDIATEGNFEKSSSEPDITDPVSGEYFNAFNESIRALNINKNELFFINAVNCWPYKKIGDKLITRTPTKQETSNCKVFVDYAIELVQPLVIITLGNIALNLFKKDAISKVRGNWFDIKGIPVIPTYHPEYFEKIKGVKDEEIISMYQWDFYNDLKAAFDYVKEHYPDINIYNKEK